ncbi:MAG: LON peptidase substrate-binding domain-containing protein, partial [Lachnospiraceae bacterium]|nr:LON peptidase substrate-binding domain-containing protein [Lachnospiraceae bacterium]
MAEKEDKKNKNTGETLPVVFIKQMTLFPGISMQFDLEKKSSLKAVEAAMMSDQRIFLVCDTSDNEDKEEPARVGTVARIRQVLKLGNGMMRIAVMGQSRATVRGLDKDSAAYYSGEIRML